MKAVKFIHIIKKVKDVKAVKLIHIIKKVEKYLLHAGNIKRVIIILFRDSQSSNQVCPLSIDP